MRRRVFITMLMAAFWMRAMPGQAITVPLPPDLAAFYPTTSTISAFAVSSSSSGDHDSVDWSDSSHTTALSWAGTAGGAAASLGTMSGFAPAASAAASASASAGPNESGLSRAYAQATYEYWFRIYDPSAPISFAPTTFHFALAAAVTGASASELARLRAQAAAEILLPGPTFGISDTVSCNGGDCDEDYVDRTASSWSNPFLLTNSVMKIELVAYGTVDCGVGSDSETGSTCGASTSALVDPTISIDPGWLSSHPGAELQIGTFAVASAAIPEPPTLLVLGIGLLAALGGVRRKLRR